MKKMSWVEMFFEEKDLEYKEFTVEHNGQMHFIDNEFVIEVIKGLKGRELAQVKDVLVKIDFKNGDVNHFLAHLAEGYVKTNY